MSQAFSIIEQTSGTWTVTQRDVPPGPVRAATAFARSDASTTEKIEQTIAYMMEHLDQPVQVATLAALACVSPSHYFALFKRRTGCAPMDYFTRLRMDRARELLDSTTRTVKEVATLLGYDDPFYFSRVFKSVNRVAPSFYRQRRLAAAGSAPTATRYTSITAAAVGLRNKSAPTMKRE